MFDPYKKPWPYQQINTAHSLAKGLVGCWVMNEGSGDKVFDLSGNGNHGIITGAVWTPNGLDFEDSGSTYITIPDSSILDITDAITVSAWIILESSSDLHTIIEKGYNSGEGNEPYVLRYDHIGAELHFGTYDGTEVEVEWTRTGTHGLNELIHVVARFDGSTYKLFTNGIERASTTNSQKISISGEDLYIGCSYVDGITRKFDGIIDNVSLYNRALTHSEIKQLYINPYTMFESVFDPALFGYVATVGGVAPTSVLYGPLVGPMGGPI